ncbi:hypothetical protein EDB83DRAFT_2312681 [Lactarius deliciosus]|nr:hypothetical protein EDB83DRAFT_2312681 [Lactarius deliciosus]
MGEGGHRYGGTPGLALHQDAMQTGFPLRTTSLGCSHIRSKPSGKGGAVGPSAVCARLKTLCKWGLPPEPPRHPRPLQCIDTNWYPRTDPVGPGERDTAFGRVSEYPRHRRGSNRKTALTWAAALLGHQEANRHLSWCMAEGSHKGVGRVGTNARERDRMTLPLE